MPARPVRPMRCLAVTFPGPAAGFAQTGEFLGTGLVALGVIPGDVFGDLPVVTFCLCKINAAL